MTSKRDDGAGVPARRAALRILDAVMRQGLPLEAALDSATRGLPKDADRAFAHAIAAEVLRHVPDLDALIDSATRRRLPDDAKARFALRIALVQALALGTPLHAAISTVLPLVDGGPRKLVHGVFGAVTREGAKLPDPPNLPADVSQRWGTAWGDAVVEAARHAIARLAPIDLVFADPAAIPDMPDAVSLCPGHLRVPAGTPVRAMPGFAEGGWWVQDIAAAIPARLLGAGEGRVALDLCAAPGGKTMQLAAAGWSVTAVEASTGRMGRLRENLERTRLAADLVEADVLAWAPLEPVDAVLLDAPCSATGIFRRHPDVLHRVRPSVVAEMVTTQGAMFARAADWVKPGGQLVYATCSLEPAEGEERLAAFLAQRPDFAIEPVRPEELPENVAPAADGTVRTLPGMLGPAGGLDGFFIARMRRSS